MVLKIHLFYTFRELSIGVSFNHYDGRYGCIFTPQCIYMFLLTITWLRYSFKLFEFTVFMSSLIVLVNFTNKNNNISKQFYFRSRCQSISTKGLENNDTIHSACSQQATRTWLQISWKALNVQLILTATYFRQEKAMYKKGSKNNCVRKFCEW